MRAIREALRVVGGFEDVTVSFEAGVVKLTGSVSKPGARQAAEQIAKKAAPDALYVANGIEVVASEATTPTDGVVLDEADTQVAGILRRFFREVEGLEAIDVQVSGGIVHLSGTTQKQDVLDRAVELASGQQGVLYVDDQVEVRTDLADQLRLTMSDLRAKAKKLLSSSPVFAIAALLIGLFALLARALVRLDPAAWFLPDRPLARQVVSRIIATVLFVLGCILALDVLGATSAVGALLGTAGVVGLAVGFAFKDIVENYLAGVLLALHRPFRAGDLVEFDGVEGKVIRLAARETVLMTLEGNHVRLPNAQVFKSPSTNYTRNPKRRFDFTVGIGTGERLADAQRVGLAALHRTEGTLDDPSPAALVSGFGDSAMNVQFFGWIDQRQTDWLRVRSEAIRQVKRSLDEAGVDLPNPIYELDVYTEEGKRAKHLHAAPAEPEAPAHPVDVDQDIDRQIREDEESAKPDMLEEG